MKIEMQENNKIREKINTTERQETVDTTIEELKTSLETLGIEDWDIPTTKIKFVEQKKDESKKESLLLGHVEVYPTKPQTVHLVFDERFSTPEKEKPYVESLHKRDLDYVGMQQALKHEFAHIAMWSVTGQDRQAATRTIDEGWANLVQATTDTLPIKETKKTVREGLSEKPETFGRCLDFGRPVSFEENLNAAEGKTGKALLLWVHQECGGDKMVELIKKSPEFQRRNDELPENKFEPALIDKELHKIAPKYISLMEEIKLGKVNQEDAYKKFRELEGQQFEYALIETTNSENIEQVRKKFLEWINK
jgi:hypothetical protein